LLARGIWKAPYLVDGFEVLVAIDSRSAARKHLKLRPGVSEERAAAWLEQLLDRIDPVMKLELVNPSTPAAPKEIDEALYDDPRSPYAEQRYRRFLVKRGANVIRPTRGIV
jgi:hypothetical protein